MGLLDQLSAGLLGGDSPSSDLGLGILAANQPSPVRLPFGGILAQGVNGARQQAMAAQELRKRALELQMQQFQAQAFQQSYPIWQAMIARRAGGPVQSAVQGTAASGGQAGGGGGPGGDGTPPMLAAPQQQQAPQQSQGGPGGNGWDDMNASMFGSMFGMPGAAQLGELGKAELQYDPRVNQAVEAAKSPLAIALAQRDAAAAAGSKELYAYWNNKVLTESKTVNISDRNGNVTTLLGGFDANGIPRMTGFNPDTGIVSNNQGATALPGFANAKGEIAGAESRGQATGKVIQQWDPVARAYRNVPMSSVTGGGVPGGPRFGPSSGAPQGLPQRGIGSPQAAGYGGNFSAPGPQTENFNKGRGTAAADYLTASQSAAEAARDTNYSLDQIDQAAAGAQLGPGAPVRAFAEKALSGFGQQFGIAPSSELANYQELEKYANKIAFAATKQMGSREAAQIVKLQIESNPNKSLVPEAFTGITQSMRAMNNYIIDKNVVMQGAGEDAQNAAAKWTQQIDPKVWALTLSPQLGEKWAASIGKDKIQAAYQYMQPDERAKLLQNIPMALRKQWLAQ